MVSKIFPALGQAMKSHTATLHWGGGTKNCVREAQGIRGAEAEPVLSSGKEGFPEKVVCDLRNEEQRPREKRASVPKEGFVWEKRHGGAER